MFSWVCVCVCVSASRPPSLFGAERDSITCNYPWTNGMLEAWKVSIVVCTHACVCVAVCVSCVCVCNVCLLVCVFVWIWMCVCVETERERHRYADMCVFMIVYVGVCLDVRAGTSPSDTGHTKGMFLLPCLQIRGGVFGPLLLVPLD